MSEPLLRIEGLRVTIHSLEGQAQILDHVGLTVPRGRIVGVVGESGCGKSTLVRAVLGILPRGARVETGRIVFEGRNLLDLREAELERDIRGQAIGFIPQDPYLAFNPVFRVGTQLLEILAWHESGDEARRPSLLRRVSPAARRRRRARLVELLRAVQIPDPEQALERYPHQFSGGQRQRLLIAGALLCRPRLVIADEPTTALDVTTQQQILGILKQLAAEFQVAMVFVTHDFGVVAELCDEVTVMYAGQSVESAPTAQLIERPQHPYTQALLGCHPDHSDDLTGIPGSVPSPTAPPAGCRFHPRCPHAREICIRARPRAVQVGMRHDVRCVLYDDAPAEPEVRAVV
ncbi:MAG: ABC transporter ATP-binding protein [Geminicoccaceae bacterium]